MLFQVHLVHRVANVTLIIQRLKLFQEEYFQRSQIKILNSHKFTQTDVNQGLKPFFGENYSFIHLSLIEAGVYLKSLVITF